MAARVTRFAAGDIRTLLGMDTAAAHALALLFCSATIILAHGTADGVRTVWPSVVAAILLCAAVLALVSVPGDPLPVPAAVAATVAGPAATALVLSVTSVPPTSSWFVWPASVATAVQTFMCARGRMTLAWIGGGATILTCVSWTVATGQGAAAGLAATLVNVGPLVMSTFFALKIRPMAATIFALRARTLQQAAAEAASQAVLDERDRQARHLDAVARPLLEKVAGAGPVTEADVAACVLVEASLRDLLRAPELAAEPVSTAADDARRRGVEVILLDDGALVGVPPAVRDRVLNTIAAHLDSCATGVVTVRILPPRRALLVTVVTGTSDGDSSRLEIGADGHPAAPAGPLAADGVL